MTDSAKAFNALTWSLAPAGLGFVLAQVSRAWTPVPTPLALIMAICLTCWFGFACRAAYFLMNPDDRNNP